MNTKMIKMALAGLVLSVSGFANAGIIYSFSGGVQTSFQNFTYGFEFTALKNLTIDSLGFFDFGMDGLSSDHRVGIWSTGGVLLTSTTVTNANSSLEGNVINNGQFRFTDILDFNILSGESYIFGAAIEGASDRWYAGGTNIGLEPSLVSIASTGNYISGNMNFPSDNIGNSYHAGSFTARATDVPEPSTLAILGLGLMGLASRRFKKQS